MQLKIALQNEIRQWLESGRSRTLKSLAKKSGLGYATIRRIENGEVQPQPHTVMKIIRVTRESAELVHGWVLEHMPEYSSHSHQSANLGVVYRAFEKSSATHAAIFRELNFGSCKEVDLINKLGPSASRAIDEFVVAKVAARDEENIRLAEKNVFIGSNEMLVREVSKQNIDNFDPNLPGNVGFTEYFATDAEGAKAYYYLVMEFQEKLEKLRGEHQKSGDRKIGITGFMTMYGEGTK